MCLSLEKDWKEKRKQFRKLNKPLIVYKLLKPWKHSVYEGYCYELGMNESGRKKCTLFNYELDRKKVHTGFHFFLTPPEECTTKRCAYTVPCDYNVGNSICTRNNPTNKLVKFRVQPKDIVAVGNWRRFPCLVATKAEMLEE